MCNRLSAEGHSLVVIDIAERAFQNLSMEFSGFRVEGDATELAILRDAKVQKADVVIAATRDDNVNLMVVQTAKIVLGVKRVQARVFEPRREAVYQRLGVETVCPTLVAAELILETAVRRERA